MRLIPLLIAVVACANHAKQSITLYEAGDYAGAARAADEGLTQHPDDGALWGMRVRSALALGDADGVAKAYQAYVAKRGGDDKDLLRDLATATIEQALASPSSRLEIAAIETIEKQRIVELLEQVMRKMEAQDERVAAAAAIAVLYDHQQAFEVIDGALRSERGDVRRLALDGLARKTDYRHQLQHVVGELEKAGDDPDARVRAVALHWLGIARDADAVELCTQRLRDPDDSVRAAAATALARIGLGNLADVAKRAIADKALAVRLAGVELYAAAHRDDELAKLAAEAAPDVAIAAALALRPPRADLTAKAFERAVVSPDAPTRAGAANQLVAGLGKAAALPVAQRLAADPDVSVRVAAARALERAGDRETARRVFAEALTSDHGVQAAADLAALGDDRGLTALAGFVRDPQRSPEQRAEAVSAHRTAHRVTPALVAALADGNGLVRVEAAATLGDLAK